MVMDTQQTNGGVSLAEHDQMVQILQQLNNDGQNYDKVLPPKEDANKDLLMDLTGFTKVCGKKKSPAKTQPKTIVDSPRTPRTSHHQPQRTDLPPWGQEEAKTPTLRCHPGGHIEDQIQQHMDHQKKQAEGATLKYQLWEAQMHLATLQRQQKQQVTAPQQQQLSVTDEMRQRKMAASHAKDSRPAKKFGGGAPFDYRNCIARFEQAINNVGMDERMKLLEMSHWFSGNAGEVVDCYSAHKDAGIGYVTARLQLDAIYSATCDSVLPLVRQIAMGKPVSEFDLNGHVKLFTKMISAEWTASKIGQLKQLDWRENIADIAENWVKHIAKKVWGKDKDLKEREGRHVKFSNLKRLIQRQINMLTTRKTLLPLPPQIKVAANVVTRNDAANRRSPHSPA